MEAILEQEEIIVNEWRSLYGESWTGVICPEAFAHPAKYSRALVRFIYQHVIDCGWIHPGENVVDPFGGVALGGLDAMLNGLHWCGCELEFKFVGLGNQNIALWNDRYSRMPQWGTARLIQGDSRKIASVLGEARIAVSSPPYVAPPGHGGGDWTLNESKGLYPPKYGESEGQLGAMKEGDLNMAISSPPYSESMNRAGGIDASKSDHTGGPHSQMNRSDTRYGATDGQLGSMKEGWFDCAISSPPFSEPQTRDRAPVQNGSVSDFMARAYTVDRQGASEGNIAALSQSEGGFQAAISSPPYEGNTKSDYLMSDDGKTHRRDVDRGFKQGHGCFRGSEGAYGQSEGQLGTERGEDFWSASRLILEQLHQVLTPGAHAVFVVKAFVRNKQIVDFPGQWAMLCEAVGFKLIHHHRALLTEDHGTQGTFHGEDKTLTIARKSFFRRLAESKGSPRIDWESVLCFEKIEPTNTAKQVRPR